jgi:hypothetical protein
LSWIKLSLWEFLHVWSLTFILSVLLVILTEGCDQNITLRNIKEKGGSSQLSEICFFTELWFWLMEQMTYHWKITFSQRSHFLMFFQLIIIFCFRGLVSSDVRFSLESWLSSLILKVETLLLLQVIRVFDLMSILYWKESYIVTSCLDIIHLILSWPYIFHISWIFNSSFKLFYIDIFSDFWSKSLGDPFV